MKTGKRVVSMLLTIFLIFGTVALTALTKAEEGTSYQVGDLIEYGTYPQSLVTDENLIAELDQIKKDWTSYDYYSGTGVWDDGNMAQSEYMLYADFFYEGQKYRGVYFSKYRPLMTGYLQTAEKSQQDENGYFPESIYYFLYEPLVWRVLNPITGYVVCNEVIDSQAYQNTIVTKIAPSNATNYNWSFANNYPLTTLRKWLNYDFTETAFTYEQLENIKLITWNNDAYSTSYSKYNAPESEDKITAPSYFDMKDTSYGFSNAASRKAKCTDYAMCQGVFQKNRDSMYWLRTPGKKADFACGVTEDGSIVSEGCYVGSTRRGVRPACCLNRLKNDTTILTSMSVWPSDYEFILPVNTCGTLDTSAVPPDEELLWTSSDPSVATVDEDGLINAEREGITFVSLKTKSKRYADKCKVIVRGNGNNVYSLGEETYGFNNFPQKNQDVPCTCKGGHCFGLAATSSMYYLGLLDRTESFGDNEPLYDKVFNLDINKETIKPICHFKHSQNIRNLIDSKVAGGSYATLTARTLDKFGLFQDSASFDWPSVVEYIKNHKYDNKGNLIILFWGRDTEGGVIEGHAVNFLRYEIVNGEERIYAYDNNYPNNEVYFSRDKEGKIHEFPKCCFVYSIDSIGLFDTYKLFEAAERRIDLPVIYPSKGIFVVEDVTPTLMCGEVDSGSRQIMYEIPEHQKEVRIAPLTDHAEFTYMDQVYHIDREDENTIGILKLAESEDDTGTLTIVNDPENHVHLYDLDSFTKPTCTDAGEIICKCSRCGDTTVEAVDALGHYDNNDDNICDDCGEPMPDEEHTHTYTAAVTTDPTCSTDGETTYTCSICGDTYTEPIPATGEHEDADNDGYCDTCEEMMQGGQHCKYCGKIHDGPFGWLIKFFHSILAIFKR